MNLVDDDIIMDREMDKENKTIILKIKEVDEVILDELKDYN